MADGSRTKTPGWSQLPHELRECIFERFLKEQIEHSYCWRQASPFSTTEAGNRIEAIVATHPTFLSAIRYPLVQLCDRNERKARVESEAIVAYGGSTDLAFLDDAWEARRRLLCKRLALLSLLQRWRALVSEMLASHQSAPRAIKH